MKTTLLITFLALMSCQQNVDKPQNYELVLDDDGIFVGDSTPPTSTTTATTLTTAFFDPTQNLLIATSIQANPETGFFSGGIPTAGSL